MFYQPKDGHGLAKNPFNSLVVPRPIGWISSVDKYGVVNLAPYSFFNATSYNPPTVMFSAGHGQIEDDGHKDSLRNIIQTREFVHNFATWDTRNSMNESSATTGKNVDEMELTGLTPIPSKLIQAPRVKETPVHFECKLIQTISLPNDNKEHQYTVVFGEVIGIHINDNFILPNGQVDIAKLCPIGRMGYQDYSKVTGETVFTMERPDIRN